MMKAFLPLAAIAGAALLAASCKSDEQVDLKLNLKAGSEYVYQIHTQTTTTQRPPMSDSIVATQDVTMEMTYAAGPAQAGNQEVTVTYDRLAMKMKSPMGEAAWDSHDSAGGNSRLSMLGAMLNKPFRVQVSPEGKIERVEGLDDIIRGIGDTSSEEGMAVRQQLAATFNDTAVRSLMRQSLDIFPGHPVKRGDSWTKSYNMDMNVMQMKVDNVFTLEDVDGNTAHLKVKAKISGDGNADIPGMKDTHITLAGDQTGTMDVDIASGLVTKGNVRWHISGDMSFMGMKVPMSIDSKVDMTAKKK